MKKLILAGLIVALLIVPMGCGKPEVEEGSYEAFVAEYYQTKFAIAVLQNKYDELEASYERDRGRDVEYANAIYALSSENGALQLELALVKALGESQRTSLEAALNELASLKKEKLDWRNLAMKEAEAILAKYNTIADLFPPSHFADKAELVEWRASSGNMTEDGCLGLQRVAFAEGYIVSLHPSFDYCTAAAGDTLYKITPGDEGLVEKIGKVE